MFYITKRIPLRIKNKKLALLTYYERIKETRRECFLENEQKKQSYNFIMVGVRL